MAACCGLAGCGGSDYANKERPPSPINVTAAIGSEKVSISPKTFGAGPLVLVVSNQSSRPQRVTFETDELGGRTAGRRASTRTIAPHATGRLTIDARSGSYAVHVGDRSIRAAHVRVGPPRPSAQDRLLLP